MTTFDNKIQAFLPEKSNYIPLGLNENNKFIYQDKNTKLLRIISPEPEPFGKEWNILLSFQSKKADKSSYQGERILIANKNWEANSNI